MTALILQHGVWGPPGVLGDWAAARGIELDIHHAQSGAPLPALNGQAFIASLGSPHNPADLHIPEIAAELAYVEQAIARDIPVLGLCFGGQMLARVLGGEVSRGDVAEIGWLPVRTTDPELVPQGPWFQWHFDTFTTPPGATLIAESDVAPQAFVWGRSLGLQFHPEVTPEIMHDWVREYRHELDEEGVDPDALLAETDRNAEENRRTALRLLERYLDQVARLGSAATPR
jgi:GMP synthase-like glutamine amidotransferase